MSLLITSSRQEQFHTGANSQIGIENPAQYRNTLRSPLQIKADSEIAVQSIKCVRESGIFTVTDDTNCRFLILFGDELTPTDAQSFAPNCPVAITIPQGTYTAHQFAKEIQVVTLDVLRRAYPNFTNAVVDRNFAGTGGGSIFDGFEWVYSSASSVANDLGAAADVVGAITASNRSLPDTTGERTVPDQIRWTGQRGYVGYQPLTDGFDVVLKSTTVLQITASHTGTNASKSTVAVMKKYPLSESGGVFTTALADVQDTGFKNWAVGLTRGFENTEIPIPGNDNFVFIKKNLDKNLKILSSDASYANSPDSGSGDSLAMWWDYCVYFDSDKANASSTSLITDDEDGALSVLMSGVQCDHKAGTVNGNVMYAIPNASLSFAAGTTNASLTDKATMTHINFTRTGTAIEISVSGTGGQRVICAKNTLNPVTLSTNMLYPKLYIEKDTDTLVVNNFGKGANTNALAEYGTRNVYGLDDNLKSRLDIRYDEQARCLNDPYNEEDGLLRAPDFDRRYTNSTLNGSNLPSNSNWVMLFSNQTHYLTKTESIFSSGYGEIELISRNSTAIFGFSVPTVNQSDFAVSASSTLNSKVTFISTEVPNSWSTKNMFVRFNSVQVASMNANKGSISKIMYGIPTFDSTGNSEGPLYFEPPERVYLDCSNSEPFNLTDVSVDIVDVNEQVITGLTGQTTVCFHIRQKSK